MSQALERPLHALKGDAGRRQPPPHHDRELDALVGAARAGDGAAWSQLVRRFDRMMRSVARSYRLAPADVDDVVQSVWAKLLTEIHVLREPAAIGGWLVTVTRRTAMRHLQGTLRERPTDDPRLGDAPVRQEPEDHILANERRATLACALKTLPDRQRRLMTLLLADPALEYRQVSELLEMPIGSIGPSRGRSLARLAGNDQVRALRDAPDASPVFRSRSSTRGWRAEATATAPVATPPSPDLPRTCP